MSYSEFIARAMLAAAANNPSLPAEEVADGAKQLWKAYKRALGEQTQ